MSNSWKSAVVMGIVAFVGLFMASGAQDGFFYATGLGLFIFGVLYIFVVIHRNVGHPPEHHGEDASETS